MALFPAYAASTATGNAESDSTHKPDASWLRNTSYVPGAVGISKENQSDEPVTKFDDSPSSKDEVPKTGVKHAYVSSDDTSDEETSRDDSHSSRHKKKKKKKKKKHKKHKKHHRHEEERPAPSPVLRGQIPAASGKVFLEDVPAQDSPVTFSIDRTSDRNNYIYGGVYRTNVARSYTLRICLGTENKTGGKRAGKNKIKRYYYNMSSKKAKKKDEDTEDADLPLMDADDSEVMLQADTRGEIPNLGEYVPMIGSQGNNEKSAEQNETRAQYIKRCTEEYNKHLARNPKDIPKWLEFIDFQDEYFKDGGDLGIGKNKRESERLKRQEALIFNAKQAIFERGITENAPCVTLKLEQLRLCQDYWEHAVLLKEWKQLVFLFPNNLQVWQRYLSFIESNVGKFTISGLKKAYKKCISVLKGIHANQVLSHPPNPGTMEFIIDTLVRLCHRLRQAGHVRAAVGLFQGVLEFNLHPAGPEVSKQPASLQLEYWTAFWESDAPHLGDHEATGWGHWVGNQGDVPSYVPWMAKADLEAKEDSLAQTHTSKWSLWRALEKTRSASNWLPWRPDVEAGETAESCEDPDGLVLADDIIDAMVTVDTDVLKLRLVCAFLEFLGLPKASFKTTSVSQLGPNTVLENINQLEHFGELVEGYKFEDVMWHRLSEFVGNVINQMMHLFVNNPCLKSKMVVLHRQYQEWSLTQEGDPDQIKDNIASIRTEAKALLQLPLYRGDMLSWQQYALLECHLGNLSTARKVLNTTIGGLAPDVKKVEGGRRGQIAALLLYRTYAEMELGLITPMSCVPASDNKKNRPKPTQAAAVLASLCEDSFTAPAATFSLSNTQTVRCQRFYENQVTNLLSACSEKRSEEEQLLELTVGSTLEHWAVCAELFAYISSGLDAATSTFHTLTAYSSMRKPVRERVTEAHISLLRRHIQDTQCPLRTVRDPLTLAVDHFPRNSALLTSLVTLELRSSHAGHTLRPALARWCRQTHATANTWILAVLAERSKVRRLEVAGSQGAGVGHAIRTWFERAVSSPAGRGCVLLWRMYLNFEAESGKMDNAKTVFYRAIQQCPWSKSLYLDYSDIVGRSHTTQDLVDLMLEKELCVYTPPEEVDLLLEHTPPDSPQTPPDSLNTPPDSPNTLPETPPDSPNTPPDGSNTPPDSQNTPPGTPPDSPHTPHDSPRSSHTPPGSPDTNPHVSYTPPDNVTSRSHTPPDNRTSFTPPGSPGNPSLVTSRTPTHSPPSTS